MGPGLVDGVAEPEGAGPRGFVLIFGILKGVLPAGLFRQEEGALGQPLPAVVAVGLSGQIREGQGQILPGVHVEFDVLVGVGLPAAAGEPAEADAGPDQSADHSEDQQHVHCQGARDVPPLRDPPAPQKGRGSPD